MPGKSDYKTLEDALRDKDAILLATNHTEFRDIAAMKLDAKVFIDGKNALDASDFKKSRILYRGIGK